VHPHLIDSSIDPPMPEVKARMTKHDFLRTPEQMLRISTWLLFCPLSRFANCLYYLFLGDAFVQAGNIERGPAGM
jgi:hypothetical protein